MSYEVKYEQKAGYLHATVTGVNTKENVMRYLTDISRRGALAAGS
jgi:glycerol-3-phosphate responsive antiterminator